MQQYLNRFVLKLPHWLRWILILPVAFLADLIAQIIYRLVFWIIPFSSIHPYTDELAWRFFAPLIFVVAGTKMAPRHWLIVACALIVNPFAPVLAQPGDGKKDGKAGSLFCRVRGQAIKAD